MEISTEQRGQITALAQKYKLKLVLLFGSQATGLTHSKSDVDIGVLGEGPISFDDRLSITGDLYTIFKRGDVEIADLRTSPPLLQREATMEGIVLYESGPNIFERFLMFAQKNFFETKPLRDIQNKRLARYLVTT